MHQSSTSTFSLPGAITLPFAVSRLTRDAVTQPSLLSPGVVRRENAGGAWQPVGSTAGGVTAAAARPVPCGLGTAISAAAATITASKTRTIPALDLPRIRAEILCRPAPILTTLGA